MHVLDAGLVINALSGLFMVALGVFVLTVRSGRVNRGFALFAVPFGCTWVLENVWGPSGDHRGAWVVVTIGVLLAAAAVGLVLLAGAFHTTTEPSSRRHARLALAIGLGVLAADTAFFLPTYDAELQTQHLLIVDLAGFWLFHAAAWGLLAFLALRYPSAVAQGPREAARIRLTSLALALYPAFFVARETGVALAVMGWPPALVVAGMALVVGKTTAIVVLWLRNAAASPHGAAERWLAWLVVAAALVGVPDLGFGDSANHPGFGIARTLGVAILAYAVLRHQLLGIDVKVRWTISRSTIAAGFVAVFFIASEGAQLLFGAENEVVGLFAAGALVFAIAPLQRAAERLAEKAVPVAQGSLGQPSGDHNEAAYRRAVRRAMGEGAVSREEERDLVLIAAGLDIAPARAFEIRDEVESEHRRGAI